MNNEWHILFHAANNAVPSSTLDDYDPIVLSNLGRGYTVVNPKPTVPFYGITSDTVKHELGTTFLEATPNYSTIVGSSLAMSPDGQYLAVGYGTSVGVPAPDVLVFKRGVSSYAPLPNSTIDFYALGLTAGDTHIAEILRWSSDSQYLAVTATYYSTAIYTWPMILKRTGDTFSRITPPALPWNASHFLTVSPDMTHIWMLLGPTLTRALYKRTGDTVTAIALPSIAPNIAISANYDPSSTYLPISVGTTYAMAKRTGDTYANIGTLSGWSGVSKLSVVPGWGPNGDLFAIADILGGTSMTVSLWSRSGDTFTYLTTSAAYTVTSQDRVTGLVFNQDGTRIYVQLISATVEFEVIGGTVVQLSATQFPIVNPTPSNTLWNTYHNAIAIHPSVYTP